MEPPSVGPDDFARLADPFRAELLAHCYRLLGSMHDAEDQVQETYLRAWRSYADFEGRSSLRTWLYRIATNVCLTELEVRTRRPLPSGHPGMDETSDVRTTWTGTRDSAPPAFLGAGAAGAGDDPAAVVASREHRREALVVAWRRLSPRQRAVLILHDVLSLRALEIADMLDMSGSAVHSMLRRARTQVVAEHADDASAVPVRSEAAILREYATAFETGDLAALRSLLTDDVCCDMGGPDGRDSGRHNVLRQLAGCPGVGSSRLVPVRVNGRPGFGAYRPDASGIWRAFCIDVLTVSPSGVERIEVLEDRALFATFGLPLTYEGVEAA